MTSIYLAGKIGPTDWRHELLGWELRGAWEYDYDAEQMTPKWPVIKNGVLDTFDYVGPYFVSDDHGCGHGPSTHGCGNDGALRCYSDEVLPKRPEVRDLCLAAIDAADIVFAWLDDPTAYGTLVEIGYAKARGKKIVIAAPEPPETFEDMGGHGFELLDSPINDLWFAFSCAGYTLTTETPREAIELIANSLFPALESPIEEAFWKAYREKTPQELNGLKPQHAVLNGKYRLDFALPTKKIGIELDGYAWHSDRETFTKDRARQRELELDGWRLIRFSGSEINADADDCVRQAAALASRFERSETPV
jgi:very-short-patch-repair endonuclease